jgi:SAM-dependent methyltransferase
MWSMHDHFRLLTRWDRGIGLIHAIQSAVEQGNIVLDAGCGSGICSLLAAKYGASKVIGVDRDTPDLAISLAKENGLSKQVSFVQGNLSNLEIAEYKGKVDVVMSMIYHNDPRRDELQSSIALELRKKYLKPEGRMLPDRVRYFVVICEWPAFDIQKKLLNMEREILEMQGRFQLSFNSLMDGMREHIDTTFFPKRDMKNGKIGSGNDNLLLSDSAMFCEIDYYQDSFAYPSEVNIDICSPGRMNALKWVQELWYDNILIFSNESLSYIKNPRQVNPGESVTIAIDGEWRQSNIAKITQENDYTEGVRQ